MSTRPAKNPSTLRPPAFHIEPCIPVSIMPVLGPRPLVDPVEPTAEELDAFPHFACGSTVMLDSIQRHFDEEVNLGLEMDPDFQRAHVWTLAQRVAYVEHMLRGGRIGAEIITAHTGDLVLDPTIPSGCRYPYYALVDGKQRLRSLMDFVSDGFAVLSSERRPQGYRYSELTPRFRRVSMSIRVLRVPMATRADIIKLYLKINAGGTPHTADEIDRVRAMLSSEVE